MLSVIDYMPGDTLLHKLNPVAKVAFATDCRNDLRAQKGSRLLDSLFVHVREWRVCKWDVRIRSAGSGSSGRRRFCGTQTCQR